MISAVPVCSLKVVPLLNRERAKALTDTKLSLAQYVTTSKSYPQPQIISHDLDEIADGFLKFAKVEKLEFTK